MIWSRSHVAITTNDPHLTLHRIQSKSKDKLKMIKGIAVSGKVSASEISATVLECLHLPRSLLSPGNFLSQSSTDALKSVNSKDERSQCRREVIRTSKVFKSRKELYDIPSNHG